MSKLNNLTTAEFITKLAFQSPTQPLFSFHRACHLVLGRTMHSMVHNLCQPSPHSCHKPQQLITTLKNGVLWPPSLFFQIIWRSTIIIINIKSLSIMHYFRFIAGQIILVNDILLSQIYLRTNVKVKFTFNLAYWWMLYAADFRVVCNACVHKFDSSLGKAGMINRSKLELAVR